VLILISWRLYEGLLSKMSNGETTLSSFSSRSGGPMPRVSASVAATIVGVYCADRPVAGLITGGHYLPKSEGAMH
jgi:hypothetical protein